jgi:hypothetical protein
VLQQFKLSVGMFLGLAFLVASAPVISRCYGQRMPVVRLMKGKRISSLSAGDNWKIGIEPSENNPAGESNPAGPATLVQRESWLHRILASFSLVERVATTIRDRRLPDLLSQQFSPAGNPLRC